VYRGATHLALRRVIHPPEERTPPPAGRSREPQRSWRHRRNVLQPSRIGRNAATGCRSSRPAYWRRGTPAPRVPRLPRPTTLARRVRRRCSRRPIPVPPVPARPSPARPGRDASAQRRQQPPGACHVSGVEQAGHLVARAAQRRSAERDERRRRRGHGRPLRPAPPGGPLNGDAEHRECPEQAPGVQRPGPSGIGVGHPLQSRCAAAEQRHRVPATRIAEQHVGEVAGRDPHDPGPTCWRKHPGSVSQVVYSNS